MNLAISKKNCFYFLAIFFFLFSFCAAAQPERWQQAINYNINVSLNVQTNLLQGSQTIAYTNNSTDTLFKVYFHTYWNAFEPNSSMDSRSRELGRTELGTDKNGKTILDWDARVKDRIANLTPDESGYCKLLSILLNGKKCNTKEHETIVEVLLPNAILPKTTVVFTTNFESKVNKQIRRSGRDNVEGIRYSMSQWYPKMVEYDYQGWSLNQYIAREFYGVWGNYEVNITLDKTYKVGATGTLQNATDIGWGYDKAETDLKPTTNNNRVWKFVAKNVHDFVWAADPNFKHDTRSTTGPLLHFIYKQVDSLENKWQRTADTLALAYPYMAKTFGPYPWPSYSFIQGGDGGMEYAMATLIKTPSLGTALHEWLHSWYQQLFGTNESLYPWMDEGFTTYAELRTSNWLRHRADTATNAYRSYYNLVKSRLEEPMSTHADHYNTNYAYGNAAYSKGAVFLQQLSYIIGTQARDSVLLAYYNTWKYKHPNPNDFIRVAEKQTGLQLQWYKEYWINTTKTIDYAIDSLWADGSQTNIRLARVGKMPMPIDIKITFKDSTTENHYIPLDLMFGQKNAEPNTQPIAHPAWKWVKPLYTFTTTQKLTNIIKIEIDPSGKMADTDKRNNVLEIKW